MYIYYDFETSSRELIGQILSYAFIVIDSQGQYIEQLTGYIQLNRCQIPELGALLTNRITIETCQKKGLSEPETAHKIFQFLSQYTQSGMTSWLIGYNSNSFDLQFLRNLLIRNGLNPYFRGRLKNKDILHFVQHLALTNPEKYPWTRTEKTDKIYYSFTLEDTATAFNCLSEAQTHDALDDVQLTIRLHETLHQTFGISIYQFEAVQFHPSDNDNPYQIGKQKVRHFPTDNEDLQHSTLVYWLMLFKDKQTIGLLNLNLWQTLQESDVTPAQDEILRCCRTINPNKHFFILEPVNSEEYESFEHLIDPIFQTPVLQDITQKPSHYYELIEKDWDIEYQIHQLGFQRIDQLGHLIQQFKENPNSYTSIIQSLCNERALQAGDEHKKTNYCIQLFNRYYLNHHPSPNPEHLQRYMIPRYIIGTMHRNPEDFVSIENQLTEIQERLNSEDLKEYEHIILIELHDLITEHINNLKTVQKR